MLGGTVLTQGSSDTTDWVPNMRFPLETGPAYINSQVFRHKDGGSPPFSNTWLGSDGLPLNGTTTSPKQCDSSNYSFPWQDNFCERRTLTPPTGNLCAGSIDHKGVDIRGSVCGTNDPRNEVVAAGDGNLIEIRHHYYKLMLASETTYLNYLHMHETSRPYDEDDLATYQYAIPVIRGQTLGNIGNVGHTWPTTRHLHLDIKSSVIVDGIAYVEPLPPYSTLVRAYKRLEAGTP